jgi:glycosyltransferase involved in cell wall biosynthesis
VRFVGWISNDELPRYLASSDIYVSTSLSDAGLSASTAEAMACGLPVIVTDSGENRVWIEDGKNGFVVPLANPKILAEKIIYLIKNKDIKARFGEINRKIIEERNNYYKEMAKMERIYEEILASH